MDDSHTHQQPFPRGPLIAAGALILASIVFVAGVRLSGVSIHSPDAASVVTRELRFEDRPDGSIAVIEGRSDRMVEIVSGEQGFLRGALRALARERTRRGFGPEQPFELVARADGRLTLQDPMTGHRVDLESFGPTNAAVFARLLHTPTSAVN